MKVPALRGQPMIIRRGTQLGNCGRILGWWLARPEPSEFLSVVDMERIAPFWSASAGLPDADVKGKANAGVLIAQL